MLSITHGSQQSGAQTGIKMMNTINPVWLRPAKTAFPWGMTMFLS
jgi:hypothetical protein